MATFKEQILSITGTIDDAIISDNNLSLWTSQSFGEIFPLVPKRMFSPLSRMRQNSFGLFTPVDLGGDIASVGEFNRIVAVYLDLSSTMISKKDVFDAWSSYYGADWSTGDGLDSMPKLIKAREIAVGDFIEVAQTSSKPYFTEGYGENRHYNKATPLDPIFSRVDGNINCQPYDFVWNVLYINTPAFEINQQLSATTSGFVSVPSEIRNIMSLYVARMLKIYELDNLTAPVFVPSVEIDNYVLSDEFEFMTQFQNILQSIRDDSENLISDEDTELATVSLKSKVAQLEVLAKEVGAVDADVAKKVTVISADVSIFAQKLARYTAQYTKMNKDLETLTLKYNESIAAINGQTFAGKASVTELEKLKQEVANLKAQLGRGGRR